MGKRKRNQNPDPQRRQIHDHHPTQEPLHPHLTPPLRRPPLLPCASDVPWDIYKYWTQAYFIFSLYDSGIWMTDTAWFSVTHEAVAAQVASHIATAAPASKSIIIDAFAGVGGNTIAFALSGRWKRVYAIEKDWATLQCAKRNAEVYGVGGRITWFHGDCFELLGCDEDRKENKVDALSVVIGTYGVLFASPPWGGPGYKSEKVFDLEGMEPYGLRALVEGFEKVCRNMVLYLPRTSDSEAGGGDGAGGWEVSGCEL